MGMERSNYICGGTINPRLFGLAIGDDYFEAKAAALMSDQAEKLNSWWA
jgi:hypothetical protein